jgi:SnoaL-like domain
MDLVALEEIRRVKYRYLRCVDLKLWDEMEDVFTADASAEYGTHAVKQELSLYGRDAIVGGHRDRDDVPRADQGRGLLRGHLSAR